MKKEKRFISGVAVSWYVYWPWVFSLLAVKPKKENL